MSLRKQISIKLRKARREQDISQSELAFRVKTGQNHISEIEKGNVGFNIDTLEKIMKALSINLKDLI
ncbi:MAG: helix-turn-helix transcriptional regulator [Elusimicrobiaceae bacterium]|jgi:transcriptional regulator with XRE-family HTH domain|nr:helix-turn-helix transcriptional regulator [Elusimicrobiaceae bacterium]MBT3955171.1 helix-turn-helix transcriptional regulator [Elusimicrobiaceae bacterium]MBT4008676.1 helix-turn-helix transcriptional regulator [Elusimicrobiaceae bacterium]MBT4402474.1 helix-turn-helix transcriptional regulator [Elusimicrobiaceae bacterium]MBT4439420.1 helix-turn-helix transcriptional regulator [Elusimicrobiaceae bacterium]